MLLPNNIVRTMNKCMYASMQAWEYSSMQVCKYSWMQMCKNASMHDCNCANMKASKYAFIQLFKYAIMQSFRNASKHVCKYASVQVCKNASMQVFWVKTFLTQILPGPNFFKPRVPGGLRIFRAFASLFDPFPKSICRLKGGDRKKFLFFHRSRWT